jgi:hypothetical protein
LEDGRSVILILIGKSFSTAGRALLKKIAMRPGPFKPHMIFFEGIDQDPIWFEVAVPATREFSSQWMLFEFTRQWLCINQQIENTSQLPQVFLELRTAAETPHKPRSA